MESKNTACRAFLNSISGNLAVDVGLCLYPAGKPIRNFLSTGSRGARPTTLVPRLARASLGKSTRERYAPYFPPCLMALRSVHAPIDLLCFTVYSQLALGFDRFECQSDDFQIKALSCLFSVFVWRCIAIPNRQTWRKV